MIKTVSGLVEDINRRKFTNNMQRVLFTLLKANGGWVKGSSLRVPSASSRIRDLRKPEFGNFDIQCEPAMNLGLRGNHHTFYYRLNPRSITLSKIWTVFNFAYE